MALTQVRLQGTLDNAGYATASPGDLGAYGTLRFKLLGSMRDTAGNVVVPGTEVACAVVNGAYDITVFATDSPGVATAPAVLLYTVTLELVVGNTAQVLSYGNMPVPAALAGGGYGLDDLVPVAPVGDDIAAHIANTAIHSGGRELGYVEGTIDQPLAASLTGVDIPSMAVSVTTIGKPVSIAFGGHTYDSAANVTDNMLLLEDGVQIDAAIDTLGAIGTIANLVGYRTRTPAPGSHVYKLQMSSLSTGHTVHAYGGATAPLYLSIRENA